MSFLTAALSSATLRILKHLLNTNEIFQNVLLSGACVWDIICHLESGPSRTIALEILSSLGAPLPTTESSLTAVKECCTDIHTCRSNTHLHTTPRAALRLSD